MRTPRRTWMVLASLSCLCVALAPAGAAPADKPDGGAAEQAASKTAANYQQIMREYQAAQQAFSEAYRAAATDEQRQKIVEEKYPQPDKYAPRMLDFAEKNPDDPSAVDALAWVVSASPNNREALDRLTDRYIQSEKLAQVAQRLGYGDENAEPALQKMLEKSPHRQVKAQATYALGQYQMNRGKPEEAEKRFEEVIEKYADIPSYRGTLGEAAKAQLFEARNLVVGKAAPEIEGQDVDGKKFKLSDYRGKVVVLDFWGDW
jgi:tetratricopeptide (TPR) repeat protein